MAMYSDLTSPLMKARITFRQEQVRDDDSGPPDKHADGFWPSLDKDNPGYIGDNPTESFASQKTRAEKIMYDWQQGYWHYIGIKAVAVIVIPGDGASVCHYELRSAGLWGIESDRDASYLAEVYEEQKAELLEHIRLMAGAQVIDIK